MTLCRKFHTLFMSLWLYDIVYYDDTYIGVIIGAQFWSILDRLIERALTAAEFPARLEPSCLSRNDGKRPDG